MSVGGAAAPTLTERAARYWAHMRYDDLPADTIRLAKRFLIDTLAAAIAGADSDVTAAVLRASVTALEGGHGPSAVWGHAATLPPPYAALVNGTSAHALELDDFGGCGHPGAVVMPVVCALGDRGGISGKDALIAIVAGYDMSSRVLDGAGGYGVHNEAGWHSTGTCGTFGAAAAAARLLRLDDERFADALGIAGTYTGGIWAFLADGAMTKRFHPGKAGETGLSAALLAQAGMTGPRQVLEAQWGGFFSTYAPGVATPEATLHGLGTEFGIARSGMKPYACCRNLHACIDALLEMMGQLRVDSRAIAEIVAHGDAQACRQFDRPRAGNLLDAQFSMQYALAVAAVSGGAALDQFVPLRGDDPEVKRLMAATRLVDDRKLKPREYPPIEIRLVDGRSLTRQIQFAKGAAQNPLTDRELEDKVTSLIAPVLGSAQCRALVSRVAALENVADLRELTRLTVPAGLAQSAA